MDCWKKTDCSSLIDKDISDDFEHMSAKQYASYG